MAAWRTEKTAAASVDETMAPKRSACSQDMPRHGPSRPPGRLWPTPRWRERRKGPRRCARAKGVLNPPSKRINASAMVPSRKESPVVLEADAADTVRPCQHAHARKRRTTGIPSTREARLNTTARSTRTPSPDSSNAVANGSTECMVQRPYRT